jgi:hypothetical protein
MVNFVVDPKVVYNITTKVGTYASFWGKNGLDLDKVKGELLKSYCESRSFTKEEYDAFRDGLGTMLLFFEQCAQAVEQPE